MLAPFLLCITLVTVAFAQDKKPDAVPPTGTTVVSGRVIYEDNGQPATRHRVQLIASAAVLTSPKGLRIPTAITNERGEFSLQRVDAGEYYLVALPVDERGSNRELTSILARSADSAADAARVEQFKKKYLRVAVDGQHNVEVNVRVPNQHFGTISGMVFDAMHQPAARAMVHIVSKDQDSPGGSVLADDEGRYKVRGLPKGEYIVSANPPSKGERMEFQGSPGATYFPSTLLSQNSPPVEVLPDHDTSNVDITLISRALRSVAGTVRIRRDKSLVSNATVRLVVKGAESPLSHYLTSTDQSGHWSFSNVPDGSYSLSVQPTQIEPKPRFVQVEQELEVNGADIEDLQIEVSEGARLSGIVTLEGSGASPQFINISATSHKQRATSSIRIDEVGKFALTGVPQDEVVVSAFAYPEDKFYVKSIDFNGADLLRGNLALAESDEIKNVRIVISTGVGVITGRVLSQVGDRPVAGANVLLRRVADDGPRLYGGKITGLTDDRGVFTLSAGPGNYHVVAWRSSDGPAAFANAMDKAILLQGNGITLSPSDRKEIVIRLP